ncbi:hypothetical protein Lfu02_76830 [Longispora fulva]|nr:hypothetical protein Lfu02_76830 [Longispora fulva]
MTKDWVVVHERVTRLVCLNNLDGTVVWDVPVGTWPRSLVLAGDRCLAIAQNVPYLVCLDIRTGERLWAAELPEPTTGHVTVVGDVVLAGGWRGSCQSARTCPSSEVSWPRP